MARLNTKKVGAIGQQKFDGAGHPLNKGTLYIVSTPIGNPEDISLRAVEVLRSVNLIAAEDIGVTGRLLAGSGVDTEICSLRPQSRKAALLNRLKSTLMAGGDVALVSDAGTPLISDPGGALVKAAIEMQCRIEPVPGAVAAIAALTASGLNTQRFTFDGFPPRAASDRFEFFAALAGEKRTIVLYETRAYLPNTLQCLANALGANRQIAVMRDMTRATAAAYRGRIQDMVEEFGGTPPRGQYVLVIEGLSVA